MRQFLDRKRLAELIEELGQSAPGRGPYRVYLVRGGTAVLAGWRASTIDVDLYSEDDRVFRDVQRIKERLQLNIELVRPEQCVPALEGTADRHVFIEKSGKVELYHYDPYAQLLAKVVRGFDRDLLDARSLISHGWVEPERFRQLVRAIPDEAWARYPALSPEAVQEAVDELLRSQ